MNAEIGMWIAVVLLVDAAIGLWNARRLQAFVPRINVVRVAVTEALAAIILVAMCFLVKSGS